MEASTSHGKSKTRYVYKTIEQVIEEEATQGGVHKMAREYRCVMIFRFNYYLV